MFMVVTDRAALRPVRVGVEIAGALQKLYGSQFELEAARGCSDRRRASRASAPATIRRRSRRRGRPPRAGGGCCGASTCSTADRLRRSEVKDGRMSRLPARDAMPRVPRQFWVVSLAVAVILIMAAASTYAAKPVACPPLRRSPPTTPIGPAVLTIGPRALAGSGGAGDLRPHAARLHLPPAAVHRALDDGVGADRAVAVPGERASIARPMLGWMLYGVSQFLGVIAALVFVLSADAYPQPAALPARVRRSSWCRCCSGLRSRRWSWRRLPSSRQGT